MPASSSDEQLMAKRGVRMGCTSGASSSPASARQWWINCTVCSHDSLALASTQMAGELRSIWQRPTNARKPRAWQMSASTLVAGCVSEAPPTLQVQRRIDARRRRTGPQVTIDRTCVHRLGVLHVLELGLFGERELLEPVEQLQLHAAPGVCLQGQPRERTSCGACCMASAGRGTYRMGINKSRAHKRPILKLHDLGALFPAVRLEISRGVGRKLLQVLDKGNDAVCIYT